MEVFNSYIFIYKLKGGIVRCPFLVYNFLYEQYVFLVIKTVAYAFHKTFQMLTLFGKEIYDLIREVSSFSFNFDFVVSYIIYIFKFQH